MMFPKLKELDISSEHVFDCALKIHMISEIRPIESTDLLEFKKNLSKKAGVKSNEEMASSLKKIDDIETVSKHIEDLDNEIVIMSNTCTRVYMSIQSETKEIIEMKVR